MPKIYQVLSRKFNGISSNTYSDQLKEHIEEVIEDYFPSGSGFDTGCSFDFFKSKVDRLVINIPYHCMDDNGSYDEWVYPELIITPSLSYGFNMRVNWKGYIGKYKYVLHEYFQNLFSETLENEIEYKTISTEAMDKELSRRMEKLK